MEPLELKVDKQAMYNFLVRNTQDSPTKEFTDYTFYGAQAVGTAQELRQKTLGMADELKDIEVTEDPLGFYFLNVESTLVELANSLSKWGCSLMFGVENKGDFEEHYNALAKLTELYNEGIELFGTTSDSHMKAKLSKLLGYLSNEINHANRIFSSKSCFIATAVYGDINAPEVQVLRDFRDNILMENGLGRRAVDLYYSRFGERLAIFIRKHIPSAIPAIRRGLDYLVQKYQANK